MLKTLPSTPGHFSLPVNVNTIIGGIGTVLAGVIVWMVTNGLTTVKDTSKSMTKIETSLPFITQSITEVKASVATVQSDVKSASEKMVTRAESDEKQQRTEAGIKDVKDDVAEIKTEQARALVQPFIGKAEFFQLVGNFERTVNEYRFHRAGVMVGLLCKTSFEAKKSKLQEKSSHAGDYFSALRGGAEAALSFASRNRRFKSSDSIRSSPFTGSESVTSLTSREASSFTSRSGIKSQFAWNFSRSILYIPLEAILGESANFSKWAKSGQRR